MMADSGFHPNRQALTHKHTVFIKDKMSRVAIAAKFNIRKKLSVHKSTRELKCKSYGIYVETTA